MGESMFDSEADEATGDGAVTFGIAKASSRASLA